MTCVWPHGGAPWGVPLNPKAKQVAVNQRHPYTILAQNGFHVPTQCVGNGGRRPWEAGQVAKGWVEGLLDRGKCIKTCYVRPSKLNLNCLKV